MSEREDQRQRDIPADAEDVDVDTVIEETLAESQTTEADSTGTLRSRLDSPLSKRGLSIAFLLSSVCLLAFGFAFPLWIFGELLGLFVGGFAYGLATERRRYAELLLAGAVTGGAWTLLGNIGLALFTSALPLIATGVVGGGLVAALGHYFGRDLRDGLTREV